MPIFDPYIERLFQIESGGNPYAVTGSNRGLGQFGPQEERQYGINASNRTDPAIQARAVQLEAQRESGALQKVLGRPPTAGELYLAHQQGLAGGPAILGAPYQTPAWQAIRPYYGSDRMAIKAISGNIPNGSPLKNVDPRQITAGQFADYWKGKFENGMQGQSQIAAVSPRISGPQIAGNPPVSNTVGGPPPGAVSGDLANPFQPPLSAHVPLPPEKPITAQGSSSAPPISGTQPGTSSAFGDVIARAKQVAIQGGPQAVQQFMAQQGYPKSGAWCGEFAASVIKSVGGTPPAHPEVASNWRNFGTPTTTPQPGDVAVRNVSRFDGGPVPTGEVGSHVTFVENVDPKTGRFIGLGGNQSNPESTFPINQYDFRHPTLAGNAPIADTISGPNPGIVAGNLTNPFQTAQIAPTPAPAPTLAGPPVAPTSDVPASFSDRFNAIAPPSPAPAPVPPPISAPSPMNSQDTTFGHSPEAIQAAQAQGIWNPPTGQNLGGQPWNFPAMTPANPVLPSGAAANLPMLGLENPGAPFPSPFAPIPTNPDVQLPPPPPPIGNSGVQFAGGPALGAPQMPQTGGGLMGALGMGNMGGLGGLNFGALANLGGGQAPAAPQMQPDYGMQIAAFMQPPSTAGLANLLQKYRALHLIA